MAGSRFALERDPSPMTGGSAAGGLSALPDERAPRGSLGMVFSLSIVFKFLGMTLIILLGGARGEMV